MMINPGAVGRELKQMKAENANRVCGLWVRRKKERYMNKLLWYIKWKLAKINETLQLQCMFCLLQRFWVTYDIFCFCFMPSGVPIYSVYM
jgi:hypothetical protein